MDSVRYGLALALVVSFLPLMSMWLVIHPLAAFWRRRGPVVAYAVTVVVAALLAYLLFSNRASLLRLEFGFRWSLTSIGMGCLVCSAVLERQYRRHVDVATLLGLPEVFAGRPSRLLTEGIYGRIRHPRYVGILLEVSAFALFVNYLAGYAVVLAAIPVIYLIVRLEERELAARFGDQYARYAARVPRFLPKLRSRPTG